MEERRNYVDWELITNFVIDAFVGYGIPREDAEICADVFSVHVWFTIISLFLATVPFIFYNLTKEKHDMCVRELKERLEEAKTENQPIEMSEEA